MEYVIRFAISLFDLAVFMYYFHSNKKMKPVSKVWILAGFTIAAIIWTFVSNIKNPYLNLATLLIVLILLSFYYESGMWTRIINIVTFMGIGMLFEPVALLLLHAMNNKATVQHRKGKYHNQHTQNFFRKGSNLHPFL